MSVFNPVSVVEAASVAAASPSLALHRRWFRTSAPHEIVAGIPSAQAKHTRPRNPNVKFKNRTTTPTCSRIRAFGRQGSEGADEPGSSSNLWTFESTSSLQEAIRKAQVLEQFKDFAGDLKDRTSADVFEIAMMIAKHKYPTLDDAKYRRMLDEWAHAIEIRLEGQERYPLKVLKTISDFLYGDLGFRGNSEDYYNPDNSCLNRVLDTRKGIPITLSLIYMEVARRVGMPMHGVNLPSHFLLRPDSKDLEVFVDAFHEGKVIFLEDAEELLKGLWGVPVKLDRVWIERNQALPTDRFVMRILRNLKSVYMYTRNPAGVLTVIEYIHVVGRRTPEDTRDEGLCYFLQGRYAEAIDNIKTYLEEAPNADDIARMHMIIKMAQEKNSDGGGSGPLNPLEPFG